MNKLNNWAYGFALNHEGAGVGTIYYAERYFDKEGIVNPASAEAYTTEEINAIKAGAVEGATNYVSEIPKEAISLTPGKVIQIPANVKHWHGAKKDSWFSHIAVEVPGENTSNEWCEPVTDDIYKNL